MKFLIQTINGNIKHDFSFTLLQSIEYQNWLRQKEEVFYHLTDFELIENCIPVGSVEFVSNYLKEYYNLHLKPKNIPNELLDLKFTGRYVFNGTERDIFDKKFVKSNDKIKHFTEICNSAPKGNYQISEIVEFESEYRCFVYNKELVGIQNYTGDFTLFPDINKINDMIKSYTSQPISYTLDVGIVDSETFIIEVHDFFSCGLYGFSNHKILPYMFSRWYYNFIKN